MDEPAEENHVKMLQKLQVLVFVALCSCAGAPPPQPRAVTLLDAAQVAQDECATVYNEIAETDEDERRLEGARLACGRVLARFQTETNQTNQGE